MQPAVFLQELIRQNLDGKFQPKILFRRAESVAERMLSAWFSFLMYRFLEVCALMSLVVHTKMSAYFSNQRVKSFTNCIGRSNSKPKKGHKTR